MANKTYERLLDSFAEASGKPMSSMDGIQSIADEVTAELANSSPAAGAPSQSAEGSTPNAQGQTMSDVYAESATSIGTSVRGGTTSSTSGGSTGSTVGSRRN